MKPGVQQPFPLRSLLLPVRAWTAQMKTEARRVASEKGWRLAQAWAEEAVQRASRAKGSVLESLGLVLTGAQAPESGSLVGLVTGLAPALARAQVLMVSERLLAEQPNPHSRSYETASQCCCRHWRSGRLYNQRGWRLHYGNPLQPQRRSSGRHGDQSATGFARPRSGA